MIGNLRGNWLCFLILGGNYFVQSHKLPTEYSILYYYNPHKTSMLYVVLSPITVSVRHHMSNVDQADSDP